MIADLYSGIGGWCLAARDLGIDPLGYEWDRAACATREAAGLRTVRADLYRVPLNLRLPLGQVSGLIASPPCQSFSSAGHGHGRAILGELSAATADAIAGRSNLSAHLRTMGRAVAASLAEGRGRTWPREARSLEGVRQARNAGHVPLTAARIYATRPEWVALEQVPEVLPLWQIIARGLRALGYSAWCGVLNAADFGVAQTRRRGILVASRVRPVHAPEPTHAKNPRPSLFGPTRLPWVSMAEALGWGFDGEPSIGVAPDVRVVGLDRRDTSGATGEPNRVIPVDEPAPTIANLDRGRMVWVGGTRSRAAVRDIDEPASTLFFGDRCNNIGWEMVRPATTVAGTPRIAKPGHRNRAAGESQFDGAIQIKIGEALTLQGFPADYPVQGTKSDQFRGVGNAIPPPLARAVLEVATGRT